jgi:hypothetical protein
MECTHWKAWYVDTCIESNRLGKVKSTLTLLPHSKGADTRSEEEC